MKNILIIVISLASLLIGATTLLFIEETESESLKDAIARTDVPYIEIADPSDFINTDGEEITIGQYVGDKVILLDIMTYSCINCQRTFPYITSWYEKYRDDGLIVIGIHTPEFAFEKDVDNVRAAMKRFGIEYPVVLDNEYATWRAYGNRYWPRKYLIDIHGNIVYDHIGEGAYEETEKKIRELLEERNEVLGLDIEIDDSLAASELRSETNRSRSPETYFGAKRNEFLANGEPFVIQRQNFSFPEKIQINQLYLDGQWDITEESAAGSNGSGLKYKFTASDVYVVAESDNGGVFEVLVDGKAAAEEGGIDVKDSKVQVEESRLYHLINMSKVGTHTLEIKIIEGDISFFAFTFG